MHRLPAYRARMSAETDGDVHVYTSTSRDGSYSAERDGLSFGARYRPVGDPFTAEPGSLEHFLTERYCIYTADGGRLYRAELHHPRGACNARTRRSRRARSRRYCSKASRTCCTPPRRTCSSGRWRSYEP